MNFSLFLLPSTDGLQLQKLSPYEDNTISILGHVQTQSKGFENWLLFLYQTKG